MLHRFKTVVAFVTLGGCCIPALASRNNAQTATSPIVQKFDSYYQFANGPKNDGSRAFDRQVIHKYIALFSQDQNAETLRQLDNKDVRLLFRAGSIAAFYAPLVNGDKHSTNDMLLDFSELTRRGVAEKTQSSTMYKRLVANRKFSKARAFYNEHDLNALPSLPTFRDKANPDKSSAPTELLVSTRKRTLIRRPVTYTSAHIVVLVDPLCHFSRHFLAYMSDHPKLLNVFERHSIWLAPPDSVLEFNTLQKWDRANPSMQIGIIYSAAEWPVIKVWAVPTFYFFSGKRLITKVQGWPAGGNLSALKSALKQIGLMTK